MKKPDEILEAVKEELAGKTPVQIKELKITSETSAESQALAHRHAADAADHLGNIDGNGQPTSIMTVINSCQRPVSSGKNSGSRRHAGESARQGGCHQKANRKNSWS